MGRLDGKVALITGGARGQGATEARRFVAEGARVVIGDVLDDEGKAVADELGDACTYVHHDVTDADQWSDAVTATTSGHGRLDVLVNNAGIFMVRPMAATTEAEYRRVIDVNQVGVFLGMCAVVPAMTETGGGSIVNISSVAGLTGTPAMFAYSASKWAVRGMTKTAAAELAALGIRVNSVHPGLIETPMLDQLADVAGRDALTTRVPLGHLAGPEEVAELVVFLASDESRYSTGSEFVVDGGMTASV